MPVTTKETRLRKPNVIYVQVREKGKGAKSFCKTIYGATLAQVERAINAALSRKKH